MKNIEEKILNEIFEYKDEKIKLFNLKISPDTKYEMIGVNIPTLRTLAKRILKEYELNDIKDFLNKSPKYFEEAIMQGLLIAYLKIEIGEKIKMLKKFVKKIDGWAICDTVVSTLKLKDNEKETFYLYIKEYQNSNQEFEIRFLLVCLLNYYIDDNYVKEVIKTCDDITHEGYYVKMAQAWTLSFVGMKYYDLLMDYLNGTNNLDKFTYNKTLQKMIESYKFSKEEKDIFKNMKKK